MLYRAVLPHYWWYREGGIVQVAVMVDTKGAADHRTLKHRDNKTPEHRDTETPPGAFTTPRGWGNFLEPQVCQKSHLYLYRVTISGIIRYL